MSKRIVALVGVAGLIAIGYTATTGSETRSNLRRKLQQAAPPQSDKWGAPENGFGGAGSSSGFSSPNEGDIQQQAQGAPGGGPWGPGTPQQGDSGGGFGGPPPQQDGGGFGGPPPQEGGGLGGPHSQHGGSFNSPPPHQGGGFGDPPRQHGGSFDGPPPQQQGGPPPQQGGGFGGPHPQQRGDRFSENPPNQQGGPPPQQGSEFGESPPQHQGGAFGESPPQHQGGAFGESDPQQGGGFGDPPPQQAQPESGGPPPPAKNEREKKQQEQEPPPQQQEETQAPPQEAAPPADIISCASRQAQDVTVIPTWAASFPGSGAKLLWQTIEQLTGLTTSDDNDSSGRLKKGTCVTVKTHFPSRHVSPKFFVMDTSKIQHGLLMLRNPLDVLPSYFKFLYHFEIMQDPTAEPPVDRWVAWRNENFNEQLKKWSDHTDWWIKNYHSSGKLLILSFEDFVDQAKGPETLKAIGTFLGQVDPAATASLTPENEIPCLWNRMIGNTVPKKGKRSGRIDIPHFPFTIDNLDNMMGVLKHLKKTHAAIPQINDAMGSYLKKVTTAKRQVEKLLAA